MLTRACAFVRKLTGASTGSPSSPVDFAMVRDGLAAVSLVLVDVREANEFAAGHPAGAINLPLSSFDASRLPPAGGPQVVLMCRSGSRSAQALRKAHAAGRQDVLNYRGSMGDWTAHGGKTVRG